MPCRISPEFLSVPHHLPLHDVNQIALNKFQPLHLPLYLSPWQRIHLIAPRGLKPPFHLVSPSLQHAVVDVDPNAF
jgi:hypothetical protein